VVGSALESEGSTFAIRLQGMPQQTPGRGASGRRLARCPSVLLSGDVRRLCLGDLAFYCPAYRLRSHPGAQRREVVQVSEEEPARVPYFTELKVAEDAVNIHYLYGVKL